MPVASVVEMYLTLYGWQLYEIVWGVLTTTGLAYFPVIAIFVKNFIEPITSQETKAASATSLRRVEVDVIALILVIIFVVQPMVTMQDTKVTMYKNCTGTTTTMGATGTTTDASFDQFNFDGSSDAKLPLWWYAWLTVAGGVNDAVMTAVPCKIDGKRAISETAKQTIPQPTLLNMVDRFETECHAPAKAKFLKDGTALTAGTKATDLNNFTSKNLQNVYKDFFSETPVKGFNFAGTNEKEASISGTGQIAPTGGYPSCYDWWNDGTNGLRKQLVDVADQDNMATLLAYGQDLGTNAFNGLQNTFGGNYSNATNVTNIENDTINAMIKNSSEELNQPVTVSNDSGDGLGFRDIFTNQGVERMIALVFAALASLGSALILQPLLFMIRDAAPYFQSLTLMFIYMLLPIVLLVGRYKWATVWTASVTIFIIKMWSSIWVVLDALDKSLFQAIVLANSNPADVGSSVSYVASAIGGSISLIWALDSIMIAAYMSMPFFALALMAWAGQKGSTAAISPTSSTANSAQGAGQKGANTAGKGAGKIGK